MPTAYQDTAASPPTSRPGVESHDGFMLRLTLGFGVMTGEQKGFDFKDTSDRDVRTSTGLDSVDNPDLEVGGGTSLLSLDIGASVDDNLVIHGRIELGVGGGVSFDGEDPPGSAGWQFAHYMLGVGVTYYFMPINIYVTGVVGAAGGSLSTSEDSPVEVNESVGGGIGLNLDVGKEWWATDDWALGVAGRFVFLSLTDEDAGADEKPVFTGVAFGVLFSITYQ